MIYTQLSNDYKYDTLAEAIYSREVEHFHYDFDRKNFEHLANHLQVSNIYANLPTTFSPSALPFGGWGDSGNHHPGGRGFIRFATDEQVLQEARDTLS
jgi:acyl-CoA reductase-like NAD-dependent aldehyde dehydrogenase